jgi:hypothetical protein
MESIQHYKRTYYVLEEYKSLMIVVPEPNPESDCHIVYNPIKETLFFVGLDDSKRKGHRESSSTTIQDAKKYIDWLINE